jgi:hypothetical protein
MILINLSYVTLLHCISLFIFAGEPIRFRVTAENFVETSPSGPENPDIVNASGDASAEEPKVPYTLTVCVYYCDRFNSKSDTLLSRTKILPGNNLS